MSFLCHFHAYQVPVSFLSIEFDGKATRITSRVRGTTLAPNCTKADSNRSVFANKTEELCLAVFRDLQRCHLKISKCTYDWTGWDEIIYTGELYCIALSPKHQPLTALLLTLPPLRAQRAQEPFHDRSAQDGPEGCDPIRIFNS